MFGTCCSSRCPIGWGLLLAAGAISAVIGAAPSFMQTEKPKAPPAPPAAAAPAHAKAEPTGDPYPLATCIVSGEKLGSMGKPVVKEYDGREVRFCCNGCVKEFEDNKADFIKKIDAKIVEQQLPHYPLKTCVVQQDDPVTGEGSDDEKTVNYVYKNRLVRFCCSHCIKDFTADPAKYLSMIDAAVIKEQKPNYPMDTCPVTGEKLGPDAIDHVYGVSLIRFCDKECIAKFNADPLPYMLKLHEAWMAKNPHDPAGQPH